MAPSHRLMKQLEKRELDLLIAGHAPQERNAEQDFAHVFTTASVVVAATRPRA